MKIGAYDINSQFNMYSPLSADTIKRVDNQNVKADSVKKAEDNAKLANIPLTGGDLYKSDANVKVTYDRFNPDDAKVGKKPEKLDDFSLVSAKEDKINKRFVNNEENVNYKEIITDEEMDSFLKKAFRLFDSF